MSYNGTGTFNINTAGQPVVTGTTITSTAFNLLTADLATGLTTALTKDGQTTPTANIPMGTYKITGLGAGSAATDAAQYGQLQAGATTIATVTGTDTLAGTLTPAPTAYATGNKFSFIAANTNTGASTININSLGAKSITKSGTSALVAGDMVSGQVYLIEYDGTRFQLINPSSAGVSSISFGSTGLTPSTATGGAVTVAGTLAIANGGTNSTATATAGGIGYGTGTAHAYSAAGTSGYFLQSNGASAPTWAAVGASALVYVSQVVASSSSTVSFTGLTAYDNYLVIFSKVFPTTASTVNLYMTTSTNNGSSYASSSYLWTLDLGSTTKTQATDATNIWLSPDNMNASVANSQISGQVTLNLLNGTSYDFLSWGQVTEINDNPALRQATSYSYRAETSAVNAIRFRFSSGSISTGTFRLYGIVNS